MTPSRSAHHERAKWAVRLDRADSRYVRLHGSSELYTSGYNDEALDAWAARIRAWDDAQDAFVYFDNDAKGYAPHDARRLIDRLGPTEQRTR